MLLEDKNAVITGAGSGVGRASALRFAAEGARVVCADLDVDRAKETAQLVEQAGGTAVPFGVDVSNEDEVAGAIAAVSEHFGRLDVVFNNVGVPTPKLGSMLEQHTADDFQRLFAVNVGGVFFGCKHAVLRFKALRHRSLRPVEVVQYEPGRLVLLGDLVGKSLHDRLRECQAEGQRGIPRGELLGHLRVAAETLEQRQDSALRAALLAPEDPVRFTVLRQRFLERNLELLAGAKRPAKGQPFQVEKRAREPIGHAPIVRRRLRSLRARSPGRSRTPSRANAPR